MPRPAKSPSPNSRFGLFFVSLLLYIPPSFSLVACSHTAPPDPYLPLWFSDVVSVHRRSLGELNLSPTGDFDFLSR
jgi:hypothetical protein